MDQVPLSYVYGQPRWGRLENFQLYTYFHLGTSLNYASYSGFSFTDSEMGYSVSTEEVTDNLYEALTQFFIIFPEYQTMEFYVAGQSYAGKTKFLMQAHSNAKILTD